MEPALQQLVARIRAAARESTRLRIRGGGTKDFYGSPSVDEVLDTAPLQGIVSYEPSELVVTARAGTPLAELEALLASQGQHLPFEPPRFGDASAAPAGTVGGMVAAGLSGPARASVGAVRDYVLGAHLVNGRGELLMFGGQVMKNVAGYDVSRLLAGSLGTLGLIAEVSLKVLPVPPAEATLTFECGQADALDLLHAWGGQPWPLDASRWMPETASSDRGRLFLRLRGAVAAVSSACRHLGGERCDPATAQKVWTAARDAGDLRVDDAQALWRISVPQTAPVLDLEGLAAIDWHGAQRWYLQPLDGEARVRGAARAAGGHASLLMPPAGAPAGLPRFEPLSAPLRRIHDALLCEFDPQGVFDHARLLAGA